MERGHMTGSKDLEGILSRMIEGLKAELEFLPVTEGDAPPREEVVATVEEAIGTLNEAQAEVGVWSSTEILTDMLGEFSMTGLSASLYLLKEYYVATENRGNDEPMEKFIPRLVRLKMEHGRLRAALTGERGNPTKRKKKGAGRVRKDFGFTSPETSEDESGKGAVRKTLREMMESD